MSQPFIGQLLLVGFNFAPVGWHLCDGSLLPIAEYDALFNLIGTTYGGDGQSTFALPDLRGRVPVHNGTLPGGSTYIIGQIGGVEQVTLTGQQMPIHNHAFFASSSAGSSNNVVNSTTGNGQPIYASSPTFNSALSALMCVAYPGGSQPHGNMQPYLTCSWIISLYGVYPSQG